MLLCVVFPVIKKKKKGKNPFFHQTPHLPWDYKTICNRRSPVSLISYPLCLILAFFLCLESLDRAVSGIFLSKSSDQAGQSFSVASSEKPLLTHLRRTTSPVNLSLSSFVSTYVISLPQNVVSFWVYHIRRHVMAICSIPGDITWIICSR